MGNQRLGCAKKGIKRAAGKGVGMGVGMERLRGGDRRRE